MEATTLPFVALAVGLFSTVLAAISLVAHWVRGKEHPDVTKVRTDMLDMLDKVEHWMKRERQRRLRDSHEEPAEEPAAQPLASQPVVGSDMRAVKAELRRRVYGR